MLLILVRHGSLPACWSGRYVGSTDVPLSEGGRSEAERLPQAIPEAVDTWWCSPLRRCRETAELLCRMHSVRVEPHLGEMDFGAWEGKTFDEIQREDPARAARWAAGDAEFCFPQGESVQNFAARIADLAGQLRDESGETVGVVSHGGVIRGLLAHLLGLPFMASFRLRVDRGSVSRIHLSGRYATLSTLNETRHLARQG